MSWVTNFTLSKRPDLQRLGQSCDLCSQCCRFFDENFHRITCIDAEADADAQHGDDGDHHGAVRICSLRGKALQIHSH